MKNRKNRVIEKYCSISEPVKAAFWSVVANVLSKGISFIFTPLYTRILTQEEYGFFSLFSSAHAVIMIFATLNLGYGGFNNGMLKYPDDRYRFISCMQGLGLVSCCICFCIFLILQKPFIAWFGIGFNDICLIFLIMMFYNSQVCWMQYQRYIFRYKALFLISLSISILTPLISVMSIHIVSERKYALVIGFSLVQIGFNFVFFVLNYVKGKSLYLKEYWMLGLRMNVPLIPHYLSTIILGQSDRFMINYYCGEAKVAIYSLTYSLSLMINIFVNAISATLTPWVYQKIKEHDVKSVSLVSRSLLVLLSGIVIFCILVAPELIWILGSESYMEAKWIVAPVMLSCFYSMVYSLFGIPVFYKEKSINIMLSTLLSAMLNILLNAIYIPKYGFAAAGYTTMVSYLFLAFSYFINMILLTKSDAQLTGLYDNKIVWKLTIGLTVISLILMISYKTVVFRYILLMCVSTILILKRKQIANIIFKYIRI